MNIETEATKVMEIARSIELLEERHRVEMEAYNKAFAGLETARATQEILQFVAQAIQQKAHERVAKVVSSCLSSVFDNPYEFKILFERKRGRTEAKLIFSRDGKEVDPMEASGGGMIDVAAFALRVACLIMHRPRLRQLLVLDEPFKFVSAEYQNNVRQMVEKLAEDLDLQIIMVTHNEAYKTGKIIEV